MQAVFCAKLGYVGLAVDLYINFTHTPYVSYGVKYIDLVSLDAATGSQSQLTYTDLVSLEVRRARG